MAAAIGSDELDCSVPVSIVQSCSGEKIQKTDIKKMIKMDCTFNNCNQSGFMHPQCLKELEEQIVKHYIHICNTGKTETVRGRYNWNHEKDREFLWKGVIYGCIYKNLRCNCGRGFLKRDLTWPPATYRRPRRKENSQCDQNSHLPKLTTQGSTIHYIPAVQPNFPFSEQDRQKSNLPPGAQFVDKAVVVKRGKVVAWDGETGMIKNLANPDERPVTFTVQAVQGVLAGLEAGAEVHYTTQRKKKKIEVVSVSLAKSVIYIQGVVIDWSPDHLAGIVQTDSRELVVRRKDFVPGGFVGNIVGKIVQFQEEDDGGSCVSVVKEFHYEEKDLLDVKFSNLELLAAPFLRRLEGLSEDQIEEEVFALSDQEWSKLAGDIFPFIVKVAAHARGYRLVLLLVENSSEVAQERIVRKIAASFFSLSNTAPGAGCILELLGILSPELQSILLENYEQLELSHQTEDHMLGLQSQLVFQSCLPLLEAQALHSLTTSLTCCAVLARLEGHQSLVALIKRASSVNPDCLQLLMTSLEREDKIFQDGFSDLISQLMELGGTKCCGVILHNISGKLDSLVNTSHGRQILCSFFQFGSDLQLYLVVEEMFVGDAETPPVFVQLASHLDEELTMLRSLVMRLEVDTMVKILELFKIEHVKPRIIGSEIGRRWLNVLSRRVNGEK